MTPAEEKFINSALETIDSRLHMIDLINDKQTTVFKNLLDITENLIARVEKLETERKIL